MCSSYDTKVSCSVWMQLPIEQPECWRLDLIDGDDTGSACVDETTWNTVRVGQPWSGQHG